MTGEAGAALGLIAIVAGILGAFGLLDWVAIIVKRRRQRRGSGNNTK